jgi:hypothetical protein
MLKQTIFVVTDVETDGPDPGVHSMLSFASIAKSANGGDFGHFAINIHPLRECMSDPGTMTWWKTQPEAWQRATHDPVGASEGMASYAQWVKSLPGTPVFVAPPLTFDGAWIDWYLRRFLGIRLFDRPRSLGLCFGSGVDLQSLAIGALRWNYTECSRDNYPQE